MKLTGNTILITGGATGIGREFATRFHALGNKVIIAGRRQAALSEMAASYPGMSYAQLDIQDPAAIRRFADSIVNDHPDLNVIINNAGIMPTEDLLATDYDISVAEAVIETNLLAPIRLTASLLGQLRARDQAAILNVSSGLAFLPLAASPTYCATKAAIHSYTESLRYQLRNTRVQVIEIVPPYVQTELQGTRQLNDPNAMPLKDFIQETFALLQSNSDAREILVERVKSLRFADTNGMYAEIFARLNSASSH